MEIFHNDARAVIDPATAILDGVTYPVRAIASVETRVIAPRVRLSVYLCYFVAWLLGVFAIVAFVTTSPYASFSEFVTPAALAAIAAIFWLAGRLLNDQKAHYALVVSTSAGERAALIADDSTYVDVLRLALERALVASAGRTSADRRWLDE